MGLKEVVKASAGTGKTYRLSLQYIYFLLKEINFKNIVVMTFTKKATFEIKERIFLFIHKIITRSEDSQGLIDSIENSFGYKITDDDIEKLKNLYSNMLINKESIRITTIDGFMGKIFKSCIAESCLGLYTYDLLEDESETLKLLYEDIVIDLYKNSEFRYKFEQKNIDSIIKEIKDVFLDKKYELLNSDYENIEINKEEILTKALYLYTNKWGDIAKNKSGENILSILEKNDNIDIVYKKFVTEFKKNFNSKGFSDFKTKKNVYEINRDVLYLLSDIYIAESKFKHNEIVKNAKILFETELKYKLKKRLLDFNDITYYTVKYINDEKLGLVKNGEITEAFKELLGGDIKAIMIDEFQDTSINQYKLLKLIMDAADIVVCVGDEKQSIYSWRGGYKALFENLDKSLGNDTNVLVLDKCYRSEAKIIDFVNKTFNKLENYPYKDVSSYKSKDAKGHVSVIQVEKEKGSKSANYEKHIVEMIKKNKHFKDTAVLLKSNKELEKVADLLSEEGITYSLSSKSNILEVESVKIAHKLIKYIATGDEISKFEFIRSNVFGASLKEVSKILLNESDKIDYVDNFVKKYQLSNCINSEKFDFAKEYINYFGYSSSNSKVDILNLNEYFSKLKEYNNLVDFYFDMSNNKSLRKSIVDKESVILMTIHSSKGLEFKNVYTYYKTNVDSGSKENVMKKYVEYDNEYNIDKFELVDNSILKKIMNPKCFLKIGDEYEKLMDEFKIQYPEINDICNYLIKEKLDEERNLYYVSYTRARENLYIFYCEDNYLLKKSEVLGENEIKENIIKTHVIKDYSKYKEYFSNTRYLNVFDDKYDIYRIRKQNIGTAIHYFFEVYNGDIEITKDMVRKKFGNLLIKDDFESVNKLIDINVKKYKNIINSKLDKKHEFKIYDKNDDGKMYIIDLLSIDNINKKAYIYDFKTGKNVLDNEDYLKQIDRYKNILQEYLIDYEIYTELLPLEEEYE